VGATDRKVIDELRGKGCEFHGGDAGSGFLCLGLGLSLGSLGGGSFGCLSFSGCNGFIGPRLDYKDAFILVNGHERARGQAQQAGIGSANGDKAAGTDFQNASGASLTTGLALRLGRGKAVSRADGLVIAGAIQAGLAINELVMASCLDGFAFLEAGIGSQKVEKLLALKGGDGVGVGVLNERGGASGGFGPIKGDNLSRSSGREKGRSRHSGERVERSQP